MFECVISQIRHLSVIGDQYITKRMEDDRLPILKNHIPLFFILDVAGEKMAFQELCKAWSISKSSLSDIITKYEALGLVNKINCTEDKRAIYLSLTEEALYIREKLLQYENEFLDGIMADFTVEERQHFEGCIKRALQNSVRLTAK